MANRLTTFVLLSAVLFGLPACGLKGDLYLEEGADDSSEQAQAESNVEATEAAFEDMPGPDNDPLSNTPDMEVIPAERETEAAGATDE